MVLTDRVAIEGHDLAVEVDQHVVRVVAIPFARGVPGIQVLRFANLDAAAELRMDIRLI